MSRFIQMASLGCVLVLAAVAVAQQEKPETKKEQKQAGKQQATVPVAVKNVTDALAKLDLTAEQSQKIKELSAKASDQIAAINKERAAIVGPDINKKMNQARKDAQAAGKKGKELQDAVYAAAGLTQDQIAKLRDLQTKQQQVIQQFRKAVSEILTPEQRAKAGLNVQGKAKAKGKAG